MFSRLRLTCTVLLALLASTSTPAQFSRARSPMDQVEKLRSTLHSLDRKPFDERGIAAAAKELRDACLAASAALSGLGEPLAAAAAAPHEARFRQLASSTKYIAGEMGSSGTIVHAYDRITRLLDTRVDSRGSDFEQQVSNLLGILSGGASLRSKEFQELSKAVEETKRLLADGLYEATSRKERISRDCKPIADAQNAAWARVATAQAADNRADLEHDRALDRCVAAEARENDYCHRYIDATLNKSMRPDDVAAIRHLWDRAVVEMRDALSAAYSTFQAQSATRDALKSAYEQLAPLQRDMQAFTAATDANTVVQNYNHFVRWNELFAKDFN